VFDVTLSSELHLVAEACHLGPRAVADLALAAFRFAFLVPSYARPSHCCGRKQGEAFTQSLGILEWNKKKGCDDC